MKKIVAIALGLVLVSITLVLESLNTHSVLRVRISSPVWGRDNPQMQGGRGDGCQTVSYLVLTPESSLFSPEAQLFTSGNDSFSGHTSLGRRWESGQLIEIRPALFTTPVGTVNPDPPRWTDRECLSIARRSEICIGLNRSAPADFIRVSDHGGCILRLP